MQEMQETSELTWIQVQFAKKAVDEVIKCRTTLKWTYAMGYYLGELGFQRLPYQLPQRAYHPARRFQKRVIRKSSSKITRGACDPHCRGLREEPRSLTCVMALQGPGEGCRSAI